ncbi:molecular chaperone Hsp20 [Alsobacter metallidurans]|uniref:Molecular chaperone Hsp20 n=1 Tax=Alsobacter metallidurans TaxID=340221 RepID=A0A917I6P3_9HYPH|nr:Hsp20/alpha crystallin family protein [Alsobacter metallidurans]GGH20118.1 molecular chaperone Hsp20 [Alsobacter metallidurans]
MTEPTKLPVKAEKSAISGRRDWTAFERLRADVDRLFDQMGAGALWRWPEHLLQPSLSSTMSKVKGVLPAVDLIEHAANYQIVAELPGLDEKSVEVRLVNGSIVISGEKHVEKDETQGDYHVSERRFGSFERSFPLPDGVDASKIEATFSRGVLTVVLPKTAEAQKETKIVVKAA